MCCHSSGHSINFWWLSAVSPETEVCKQSYPLSPVWVSVCVSKWPDWEKGLLTVRSAKFPDLKADKPAKTEEKFDEDSWKINIFKLCHNIDHWFPASYLRFNFATKLAGKPSGFRLLLRTWIC